jgi:CcmD family protein
MNRGLQFAFAAYGLAFLVFLVYMWLMIARQNKLDRKLDELKSHLKDRMYTGKVPHLSQLP